MPAPHKADRPTVCYVGRWDRRKRPELFFELARARPDVRFLAVGRSRDAAWEAELRARYGAIANLELLGFVDQFTSNRLHDVLAESWIYVNTAAREGLPNAFLEAAAHGCAILSGVDPDAFASDFGAQVEADDFAAGLDALLANDAWRAKGENARTFVRETWGTEPAIAAHLSAYRYALGTIVRNVLAAR
jgi:glycosyltransferase involved in cell wall biosynthesis